MCPRGVVCGIAAGRSNVKRSLGCAAWSGIARQSRCGLTVLQRWIQCGAAISVVGQRTEIFSHLQSVKDNPEQLISE